MEDLFAKKLEALRARSFDRHLREITGAQGPEVEIDGRCLINFSSNDYLGLANDPRLREAASAAIDKFGVGAGASRLISGNLSPHLRLERALANWKGTEAAVCFSSGYAAALGTIPVLVGKDDVLLLDKLCHASLIDGARLSGATLRVFPHNHMGKLQSHLEWARGEPCRHAAKRRIFRTRNTLSYCGQGHGAIANHCDGSAPGGSNRSAVRDDQTTRLLKENFNRPEIDPRSVSVFRQ